MSRRQSQSQSRSRSRSRDALPKDTSELSPPVQDDEWSSSTDDLTRIEKSLSVMETGTKDEPKEYPYHTAHRLRRRARRRQQKYIATKRRAAIGEPVLSCCKNIVEMCKFVHGGEQSILIPSPTCETEKTPERMLAALRPTASAAGIVLIDRVSKMMEHTVRCTKACVQIDACRELVDVDERNVRLSPSLAAETLWPIINLDGSAWRGFPRTASDGTDVGRIGVFDEKGEISARKAWTALACHLVKTGTHAIAEVRGTTAHGLITGSVCALLPKGG